MKKFQLWQCSRWKVKFFQNLYILCPSDCKSYIIQEHNVKSRESLIQMTNISRYLSEKWKKVRKFKMCHLFTPGYPIECCSLDSKQLHKANYSFIWLSNFPNLGTHAINYYNTRSIQLWHMELILQNNKFAWYKKMLANLLIFQTIEKATI